MEPEYDSARDQETQVVRERLKASRAWKRRQKEKRIKRRWADLHFVEMEERKVSGLELFLPGRDERKIEGNQIDVVEVFCIVESRNNGY